MPNLTFEVTETLEKIKENIKTRCVILPTFLLFFLFFELAIKIPIPHGLYIVLGAMLFTTPLSYLVLRKLKAPSYKILNLGYLCYLIFDLFLLTICIYYMGGVTWVGVLAYSFYIIYGFIVFPKSLAYVLLGCCIVFFSLLASLQYSGIIPYRFIFSLSETIYKNNIFVIFTVLFSVAVLYWMGHYSNIFSRLLKEKIKRIEELGVDLKKEKRNLEEKVKERTEKLEKKTKEAEGATKELQGKFKQLEKFQRIAVGRELKMIELKKKVKELEEKLNKR